jgi:hypothetical protein
LTTEHYRLLKEALVEFDSKLSTVLIRVEVVDEKASLIDKIEALYTEAHDSNLQKSLAV